MELNRRRYLGSLGTTAITLALAGCTSDESDSDEGNANGNSGDSDTSDSGNNNGDNNGGDTNSGDNGDDNQSDVEILDHEFYEEEFQSGVRGTAINNADRELSYVEATATFLDADGTQIGEGLDNVNDLAAGREWEFDCMYTSQDASRIEEYEVEVSVGF
ncbi:FxLYD domain-containing protein [Natrinema altunense]|uniref:FxLYD domain-containing protein n=1 Tax=Natrinema altunense TaxID=222984 RepID=UPI00067914E1|nr:FxLYD domain-containing protein [Natrinema altunense]